MTDSNRETMLDASAVEETPAPDQTEAQTVVTDPPEDLQVDAETLVSASAPAEEGKTAEDAEAPQDASPENVAESVDQATVEPEPEPEREPVVVPASEMDRVVELVRDAIRAGEPVVFPTDTVYGIAADPFTPAAVQALLDAKHRGRDMPPPVLIGDPEVVDAYARDIPAAARILTEKYWPGPLTIILNAQSSLRMDLGETKGSIAVRVPDNDVTREVLRATGPLAVSSANISGEPAATDVDDAVRQLRGSVAVYVDGGPTPGPTPSTIVDFASDLAGKVVRAGVISLAELRELLPGLQGPEPEPAPDDHTEEDPEPGGESAGASDAEQDEVAPTPAETADQSGADAPSDGEVAALTPEEAVPAQAPEEAVPEQEPDTVPDAPSSPAAEPTAR